MGNGRRDFIAAAVAALVTPGSLTRTALASEDPIPGVDVVVEKVPPGHGFAAQTDPSGRLKFRALPAGVYYVSDKYGNKARLHHKGGPASWRLVGSYRSDRPAWTLIDENRAR